jgi:phosphoribosylformimino-5-aminoimidazole carboxamide ribonucleotide (ProFAR) isomerase
MRRSLRRGPRLLGRRGRSTSTRWTWTAPGTAAAANLPSVAALTRQGGLAVEVGGGIRTEERIRQYLDAGRGRCILGTVAVRDLRFHRPHGPAVRPTHRRGRGRPGRLRGRQRLAELSSERSVDFCRRLAEAGVRTVIYTDISRDGAERGTNLARLPGAGCHRRTFMRHGLRRRGLPGGAAGAGGHGRPCGHSGQGPLHREAGLPEVLRAVPAGPEAEKRGEKHAGKTDHPLSGREGRPRGEGHQLRGPARHGRPRGAGPLLQRFRRGRAGVLRHHRLRGGPRSVHRTCCGEVASEIFIPLTVGGGIRTRRISTGCSSAAPTRSASTPAPSGTRLSSARRPGNTASQCVVLSWT